jgi:microcystin-dependent protein
MAEPFLSEIKMVGFNFAPRGWALCDGQILPISQNQSLYSLLGRNFGGDGRVTYGLPDLRGRTPVGWKKGENLTERKLAQRDGREAVTLTTAQVPAHTHPLQASSGRGDQAALKGHVLASAEGMYRKEQTNPVSLSSGSVKTTGGSQPHNNMMPFLAVNFVISLQGAFPSRN